MAHDFRQQIYEKITGGTIANQTATFEDGCLSFTFINAGTLSCQIIWDDGSITVLPSGAILSREYIEKGIPTFSVDCATLGSTTVHFCVTGLGINKITYV